MFLLFALNLAPLLWSAREICCLNIPLFFIIISLLFYFFQFPSVYHLNLGYPIFSTFSNIPFHLSVMVSGHTGMWLFKEPSCALGTSLAPPPCTNLRYSPFPLLLSQEWTRCQADDTMLPTLTVCLRSKTTLSFLWIVPKHQGSRVMRS